MAWRSVKVEEPEPSPERPPPPPPVKKAPEAAAAKAVAAKEPPTPTGMHALPCNGVPAASDCQGSPCAE